MRCLVFLGFVAFAGRAYLSVFAYVGLWVLGYDLIWAPFGFLGFDAFGFDYSVDSMFPGGIEFWVDGWLFVAYGRVLLAGLAIRVLCFLDLGVSDYFGGIFG